MSGERYYTYVRRHVRFFVLDTNLLDAAQLAWLETALQQSHEAVEDRATSIIRSTGNAGRHGSNVELRVLLEPLLVEVRRQRRVLRPRPHLRAAEAAEGDHYFVAGPGRPAAQGRRRAIATSPPPASIRIRRSCSSRLPATRCSFQAVSRTGVTVDSGQIPRLTTRIGT